ncbi:hypothetical protein [Paenibacillus apiarius]|uniref:Uncharacterized protein n=1 Tax=Paenibacillus apiarius TaxID=46240 RepID=A0ABT4DSE9_9BACL|nr:hypothetical protein [Paenibacillus apiarius]MCY9513323.1 hypothetical protein [Paenibacillus apiarius]MCY9519705.1 hypothetical protein [Paenibacillus apiarius]MCY9553239.1 hypothetical protein [Paenibacillus apiarius]MCY9557089.1 hypothetical protein [Paenibacillus apiarius]MCY9682170.1 hypothetical protein [Paenibacillus apiarius]
MAYTPTEWKNREVERPRTFRQQNNPDGTVTLIPEEGNIIESGTPIIAANMNKIEQGIADAYGVMDDLATTQYVDNKAGQAETNAKYASLPRTGGTVSGNLVVDNSLTVQGRNVIFEIDSVKQSGVNAKQAIVDAINAQGGQASTADSWATLAQKVRNLQQGLPNAFLLRSKFRYQPFEQFAEPAIMRGTWEEGYIEGQLTAPGGNNVFMHFYPEDGYLIVSAGNRSKKGVGQALLTTPTDLTNVSAIEFYYKVAYYANQEGNILSFGVIKNRNTSNAFYDRATSWDIGGLGQGTSVRVYTARVDVSDLTGNYLIGMTLHNKSDVFRNFTTLEGIQLIQNV